MSSASGAKQHKVSRSMAGKSVLSADELELFELANLTGVTMNPTVFKITVDLLHMNVAPVAIERMLRTMASSSQSQSVPVSGTDSQTSLSTDRSVSSVSSFATPMSQSLTDRSTD